MTEPYIIALDLDGTLLNSQKEIGERTKSVLKKCVALGHKLVIATGRPYRASKTYYTELELTSPMVNFNGAHVHHPKNQDFVTFHSPIPKEIAFSILDICSKYHIKNVLTEVIDEVFIETYDPDLVAAFGMRLSDLTIGPIHQTLKADPTCVLLNIEQKQVDFLIKELDSEHAEIIEQRSWGAPSEFIEIIKKGTNKATGLEKVAEFLKIPMERIIAFGDEENDVEMLREVGTGVAMGNARDFVKEAAHFTTSSNDEEGIADFLDTYFLKGKS